MSEMKFTPGPWGVKAIAYALRDDGTVDHTREILVDGRKTVFVETEDGLRGVLPMGVGA